MNKVLKMCMNWKVLAGIAAGVLVLSQVVPGVFTALPFLLFLVVCPIMMFLMMRGMGAMSGMAQSGAAPTAQPEEPANNLAMGGVIAELKAEQEALKRQIAELEARQTLMPSEKVQFPSAPRGTV